MVRPFPARAEGGARCERAASDRARVRPASRPVLVKDFCTERLHARDVSDATSAVQRSGERTVLERVSLAGDHGFVSLTLNVNRTPIPECDAAAAAGRRLMFENE